VSEQGIPGFFRHLDERALNDTLCGAVRQASEVLIDDVLVHGNFVIELAAERLQCVEVIAGVGDEFKVFQAHLNLPEDEFLKMWLSTLLCSSIQGEETGNARFKTEKFGPFRLKNRNSS
jgi:hypothetical protein